MGNPRPRRGTVSAALACALAQNVAGLHVVPFRTVTNPIHIRGGHIEASAQPGYQMPPPEVAELADAKPIPGVSVQPAERRYCLFMTSSSMLTLEDVSAPVLKLGGARFNPCTLIPHGGGGISSYHTALEVQEIKTGERRIVSGIPANARIEHLTWSPDGSKLAFSLRTSEDSDDSVAMLWLLDVKAAAAAPVLPAQPLNAVLGKPFHWLPDSCGLVVKQPIGTRATEPARVTLPSSPIVKESVGDGTKAAVRTYPDLLASEADAAAFRHYATVQLAELRLADGAKLGTVERARVLGPPAITYALSSSPDGRHLLTMSIEPAELSYAVPWPRFGRLVQVLPLADDAGAGSPPVTLQATAALEAIPIGQDAARPGPRAFEWRPDLPATLIYAEALDDGDPKKDADFRDKLLLLAAPFDGPPEELLRTKSRYSYVEWSADGAALVWTRWYQTRTTSIMFVEPAGESRLYMEYDYSDGYTHPGSPLSEPGPWGRSVLRRHDGGGLLWAGGGESADGARPFLDERSYSDGKFVRRLWRGAVGCYDSLSAVLPAEASAAVAPEAVASGVEVILLTRRQTQTVPPQMLLRAVSAESAAAASADALSDEARADSSTILATLSSPDHPQPSLKGISKTLIRYKRADGVDLSGTLYTPAGYDAATDGPLPTILWAYPREFKSKGSAGQVRGSEHTFTMIRWASPLFWLTRGYAVLDGFAMPIIGEGEQDENDNFVEQLQMNAEAAVGALRARGVSDHRLAVGGHSYGAFMTANLLARTRLFSAGIARSGAYNRALTPFGFQSEERSFWEAASTYAQMSPFNHADKIAAPLLLIHGEEDPNPGTFPMQSERLFAAIKGLGGTARLCMVPCEGHSYRARESIMHVLAEQDAWLEQHVRCAKPPQSVE